MYYAVSAPDGSEVFPIGPGGYESCWRCGPDTYRKLVSDDFIVWKKVAKEGTERWAPYQKYYLEGRDKRPTPLWNDLDGNKKATLEVKELLGEKIFSNPKPIALLNRIIDLATESDSSDIVLDFFAGSGTTAHAVMLKNAADGGNRQFILVQLPELNEGTRFSNISSITRERVRQAAAKVGTQPSLGASDPAPGFRAYVLARSNFAIWRSEATDAADMARQLEMVVQHVVTDSAEDAMLTELLLKAGYPLTSPVETVNFAGVDVYSVAEGALLVCLANSLSIEVFESMVELDPAMILVLDAGFGGIDELKVNALQTVRARNQRIGSDIVLRVV
jgi:adenine-specific DNA-methyltransferase